MTPNAFTLPAKGIHIRQSSAKQMKESAIRINRNTYAPTTQEDRDKNAGIAGRGVHNSKDN